VDALDENGQEQRAQDGNADAGRHRSVCMELVQMRHALGTGAFQPACLLATYTSVPCLQQGLRQDKRARLQIHMSYRRKGGSCTMEQRA